MKSDRVCAIEPIINCVFGFYREDEIKKLATVNITKPEGLSSLGIGTLNGLYDSRMGTMDSHDTTKICGTCKLNHFKCPGHFGCIQLNVPLYNPGIYRFIRYIMGLKCYNCHHLLLDKPRYEILKNKLNALNNGYIFDLKYIDKEIIAMDEYMQPKSKKFVNKYDVGKKKSSKKKKDNNNTIKQETTNISDIFNDDSDFSSNNNDNDMIMDSDNDNNSSNDGNNYPSFVDSGLIEGTTLQIIQKRWELFELVFGSWLPLNQCQICKCVRVTFTQDSDHTHIVQQPLTKRKNIYIKSGVRLISIDNKNKSPAIDKPTTLTVNIVKKHMKALWETEHFIMKQLFNVNLLNNYDKYSMINCDYNQFFYQLIVVPSNRYRPMMSVGPRKAGHPQNKIYRQIIKANTQIAKLSQQINDMRKSGMKTYILCIYSKCFCNILQIYYIVRFIKKIEDQG